MGAPRGHAGGQDPGNTLHVAYVIACGAGKADRPAPARDLYTGGGFRHALQAAAAQAAWSAAHRERSVVLVLSALHGLITLDEVIAPYDLKMGQPGSVAPHVVAGQAARLGITRGWDVYALLPRAYLAVLDEALRPQGIWVQDVYEGCRGIGDQRTVNRTLASA